VISELIELSAVIGDIYDAAMDRALWPQALASICTYVGGASAALLAYDRPSERSQVLQLFSANTVFTKAYLEKFPSAHPAFPGAFHLGAGDVATMDDVMPRRQFEASPFFKEWAEPQGIVDALLVNLKKDATHACLIDIPISAAASEDMRHRLTLLVPHLQRAVTCVPPSARGDVDTRAPALRSAPSVPPPPLEVIAKRNKLTATEVRVLDAVLKVKGVKAIAETLGLSQATVKTHLQSLFRKTGSNRQSDLVKLVAGL